MKITTEMARAMGMCDFQLEILESLGGEIDTGDMGKAIVAARQGLDLIWLVKKFIPDPALSEQFRQAIRAINQTIKTTKRTVQEAFDAAKAAMQPPVFLPEKALKAGLEVIEPTVRVIPTAAAFVAAFAGR